jgi:WD40 repeat protein
VIQLWDPMTGVSVRRPMPGHIGGVRALAEVPRPAGSLLAAGAGDGNVLVWNPYAPGTMPVKLDAGEGAVFALQVATGSDGRTRLVSAGNDGALRFWDPRTGQRTAIVPNAHEGAIIGLAFLAHGGNRVLASSDEHGWIKWWRLDDRITQTAEVEGHRWVVPALVAIPRDGCWGSRCCRSRTAANC